MADGTRQDVKECIDLWMFRLAWTQCGLLEGNQQATESFRNGMCEIRDGKVVPKATKVVLEIQDKNNMLSLVDRPMLSYKKVGQL